MHTFCNINPFGHHRGSDNNDENVQCGFDGQTTETVVGFSEEIEQNIEGNIIFRQCDEIIIEKDRNEDGQNHFQTRNEMKEMPLFDGHVHAKPVMFREDSTIDQTTEIDRVDRCPDRIQYHMKIVLLLRIEDDVAHCPHFR